MICPPHAIARLPRALVLGALLLSTTAYDQLWITLLEECEGSTYPVKIVSPHFPVRREFKGTSYAQRWEIMLRKLVLEKLYDSTALLLATEKGGPRGNYTEPAPDLSMKKFLAGLAGHVQTYLASI